MFIPRPIRRLISKLYAAVCLCAGFMYSGLILADDVQQNSVKNNKTPSVISVEQTNDTGIFGRALRAEEVRALDTHIFPSGDQLPDGEGTVKAGIKIYKQQCASCHGSKGEGAIALELVGDRTLLTTAYPDKGIGVYWPYAPTLFQYVQRAMPPENPGLLSNAELYSLIGYLLQLNDLLPESANLDRQTLSRIKLPNRDGFVDQFTLDVESEN